MTTKEIPNYPGYAVTEDGKILSFGEEPRIAGGQKRDGFLILFIMPNGYLRVNLGRRKQRYVHRLVLEAFIGPCPDGMEACHNNGIRTDNRLENLRWDTRSANRLDSVRHGTCPLLGHTFGFSGEKNPRHKLNETQVRWVRYLSKAGVSTGDLMAGFSLSQSSIRRIIREISWRLSR